MKEEISEHTGQEDKSLAAFNRWWHDEGSGMRVLDGEDVEEHTRRVSQIAWLNGGYIERKSCEVERMNFFSVMPCDGFNDSFPPSLSLAQTEGLAWLMFNKLTLGKITRQPVEGFTVVPVVMSLQSQNFKD